MSVLYKLTWANTNLSDFITTNNNRQKMNTSLKTNLTTQTQE